MPSTRISMCLICACDMGANVQPRSSNQAIRFVFIAVLSFEKMHAKLLGDAKANAAADGHEGRSGGMRYVPFRAEPDMHSRTHSNVGGHSRKQHISAASVLSRAGDAVILRMQPG
jgi:hypothetical protein